MLITSEQRRQHDAWRIRRDRVETALILVRERPSVKSVDVRPKPSSALLPMIRVSQLTRDWLILTKLKDLPKDATRARPRTVGNDPIWGRIVDEVAAKHGTNMLELRSARRDRIIVAARQEAMWRLKNETSMSFPAIGIKFGRDHTTVMYNVRKYEARIAAGEA